MCCRRIVLSVMTRKQKLFVARNVYKLIFLGIKIQCFKHVALSRLTSIQQILINLYLVSCPIGLIHQVTVSNAMVGSVSAFVWLTQPNQKTCNSSNFRCNEDILIQFEVYNTTLHNTLKAYYQNLQLEINHSAWDAYLKTTLN